MIEYCLFCGCKLICHQDDYYKCNNIDSTEHHVFLCTSFNDSFAFEYKDYVFLSGKDLCMFYIKRDPFTLRIRHKHSYVAPKNKEELILAFNRMKRLHLIG